jgi:hypothetical protein
MTYIACLVVFFSFMKTMVWPLKYGIEIVGALKET